jgi:hypothetical protein
MIFPFKNFSSIGIDKLTKNDIGVVLDTGGGPMYFYVIQESSNPNITVQEFLDRGHFNNISSEEVPMDEELYQPNDSDSDELLESLLEIQATWGQGGEGGRGARFPNLAATPGQAGGTYGGHGGDGGSWGIDGHVGSKSSDGGTKYLNVGRTLAGAAVINWNAYAEPGSRIGQYKGALT